MKPCDTEMGPFFQALDFLSPYFSGTFSSWEASYTQIKRGLLTTVAFVNPFFIYLVFKFYPEKHNKFKLFIIWIIVTQMAYNIIVGGDAWEYIGNRYLCVVLPFMTLIIFDMLSNLMVWFNIRFVKIMIFVFVIILLNYSSLLCIRSFMFIDSHPEIKANINNVGLSNLISKIVKKGSNVAVIYAGSIPYYNELECVDLLGKCDKKIANLSVDLSSYVYETRGFYPGHNKYDLKYSIIELKPEVIQIVFMPMKVFEPYLLDYYIIDTDFGKLAIRKESEKIDYTFVKSLF